MPSHMVSGFLPSTSGFQCHDAFLRVAPIVGGSLGWTTILEVPRDIAMSSHPAHNP